MQKNKFIHEDIKAVCSSATKKLVAMGLVAATIVGGANFVGVSYKNIASAQTGENGRPNKQEKAQELYARYDKVVRRLTPCRFDRKTYVFNKFVTPGREAVHESYLRERIYLDRLPNDTVDEIERWIVSLEQIAEEQERREAEERERREAEKRERREAEERERREAYSRQQLEPSNIFVRLFSGFMSIFTYILFGRWLGGSGGSK